MEHDDIKDEELIEEKPPILKNWKQLYAIVLSFLALQVILYYLFTQYFK